LLLRRPPTFSIVERGGGTQDACQAGSQFQCALQAPRWPAIVPSGRDFRGIAQAEVEARRKCTPREQKSTGSTRSTGWLHSQADLPRMRPGIRRRHKICVSPANAAFNLGTAYESRQTGDETLSSKHNCD
jgi:hypothetical protein